MKGDKIRGGDNQLAQTLTLSKTSKREIEKARLFVCGQAKDADDARLLLDVLGLI